MFYVVEMTGCFYVSVFLLTCDFLVVTWVWCLAYVTDPR